MIAFAPIQLTRDIAQDTSVSPKQQALSEEDISISDKFLTYNKLADVLKKALEKIKQDCNDSNWDGYGALAVSTVATQIADSLIEKLAEVPGLFIPEISAAPDGNVMFDWDKEDIYFSIGVTDNKQIFYALVSPEKRAKGKERFNNSLPFGVPQILKSYYAY